MSLKYLGFFFIKFNLIRSIEVVTNKREMVTFQLTTIQGDVLIKANKT